MRPAGGAMVRYGCVSIVHASALSVRHAIARALATHNRRPSEATWRVVHARVSVDGQGRVVRADVSVGVEPPVASLADPRAAGLVNPTGRHPLAALVPGTRTLLDIYPVSWERWLRLRPGSLPADVEPMQLRAGVELSMARALAAGAGQQLPTAAELRGAWGTGAFPWGDAPDPARGLAAPPRWGQVLEIGLFPPNAHGFFDLGCGAWVWSAEGEIVGGGPDLLPGELSAAPCGVRLAATL